MVLTLAILKKRYSIHRFAPHSTIPEMVFQSEFYTVSRTDEELSIVCDSAIDLKSAKSEKDWRIIKIVGPLDFSLTGILAEISAVLAGVQVPIFALSTFDTDYILIRNERMEEAKKTLLQAGYHFL
ncbi:ACT domain-containing protein [Crocinitomicaceae bacterium]|nr:ACT domain-containing protein [Crocinitomicaceae bacterium]